MNVKEMLLQRTAYYSTRFGFGHPYTPRMPVKSYLRAVCIPFENLHCLDQIPNLDHPFSNLWCIQQPNNFSSILFSRFLCSNFFVPFVPSVIRKLVSAFAASAFDSASPVRRQLIPTRYIDSRVMRRCQDQPKGSHGVISPKHE